MFLLRIKKKFYFFLIFFLLLFIFFWLNVNSILSIKSKTFISTFYQSHSTANIENIDKNDFYSSLLDENDRLKKLLNIKNDNPNSKILFSKVILKYPSFLNNVFLIPLGNKEGLKKDQLVFTEDKFLGKIGNVTDQYSEIYSIKNKDFALIVEVGKERYKGILKGDGFTSYVQYIQDSVQILPGDKIYLSLSKTSPIFFKPIAEVKSIKKEKGFFKIYLESDVFAYNFDYVGVYIDTNDSQ